MKIDLIGCGPCPAAAPLCMGCRGGKFRKLPDPPPVGQAPIWTPQDRKSQRRSNCRSFAFRVPRPVFRPCALSALSGLPPLLLRISLLTVRRLLAPEHPPPSPLVLCSAPPYFVASRAPTSRARAPSPLPPRPVFRASPPARGGGSFTICASESDVIGQVLYEFSIMSKI